jgi:hypothetical protein
METARCHGQDVDAGEKAVRGAFQTGGITNEDIEAVPRLENMFVSLLGDWATRHAPHCFCAPEVSRPALDAIAIGARNLTKHFGPFQRSWSRPRSQVW